MRPRFPIGWWKENHAACLTPSIFEDAPPPLSPSHFNPNACRICFDFLAAVKLSIRKSWRSVDPVFWFKCPFNKADCPRKSRRGGARGDLFDTVLPSERQRDAAAKRRCYSDLQNMWFSFRSGGFHKFSSSLVLPPSVTLLRLTEGLWECEKTILGHHVDYCTSFMCRNANQPTPPPLPPLHKFSLVAVLYNTRLPNIAIRELSRSHYFEYIIILAALSHPAHHHFSPFFLCFE